MKKYTNYNFVCLWLWSCVPWTEEVHRSRMFENKVLSKVLDRREKKQVYIEKIT